MAWQLIPADPRWTQPVIGPADTSTWGPQFPTWVMTGSLVDAYDIASPGPINQASASAQDRQLTLAGEGAPIRLTYGRDRIGGQVLNVLAYSGNVYVQVLWGYQCEQIESVTFNDDALPAGASSISYTGSQTVVDSTLATAFSNQSPSITYTDTLEGFAYSIFIIPADKFQGGLAFAAIIKGRQVYDPRGTPGTYYRDNPSLALADFLTNADYGCGKTVDWTSVGAAADWNDALVGGETHRQIGWTLTSITPVKSVIETLRTYASVFIVRRGDTYYFVQDKAGSSLVTYAHSAGEFESFGPVEKRDLGSVPTCVEVVYTDTSKLPWRDRSAYAPDAAGTNRTRLSSVRLNGIQRYSQARREAIERYNKLVLNDLSFPVTVFDKGIQHEPGDIITTTLPMVGTKAMRVVGPPENRGPGLWGLQLVEYDPAVYSSAVETTPTYDDTDIPSPGSPPAISSVSAAQEVYQLENATFVTRARLTITPPTYLFIAGYQIELYDNTAKLVDASYVVSASYATPPLQDNQTYSYKVRVVSTIGATGAWYEDSFVADGKQAIPADPGQISGFEVGGDVYLAWGAANDPDIWRYELRYGLTTGSWDTAKLLDRVDALRYVSKGVLTAGVHRVYVKSIDSIRQYSTGSKYVDITVTIDPDALQTVHDDFGTGTPVDMVTTTWGAGTPTYYVTEHGTVMSNAGMFGSFTNMSDYGGGIMAAAQADATNTYVTDEHDFGTDLTGDWTCDIEETNVSGTATVTLQLATATGHPTFTDHTTFPVKTTARYVKIKVSGTGEFKVLPTSATVTCYAVTKKEYGTASVTTGGTVAVNLAGAYFAYRSIVLTPIFPTGTAVAANAVVDDIVLDPSGTPTNGFDIYTFDDAGSPLNGIDVNWKFEGV